MPSVTNTTIIEYATNWLITRLQTIADPVATRTSKVPNSQFVSAKYSGVPLLYPCITVNITNVTASPSLGMQTEAHLYTLSMEVECYAKKKKYQCDRMADQVLDLIRTDHWGTSGAVENNLFQPEVMSSTLVVEDLDMKQGGFEKLFRRIITVRYNFITNGL